MAKRGKVHQIDRIKSGLMNFKEAKVEGLNRCLSLMTHSPQKSNLCQSDGISASNHIYLDLRVIRKILSCVFMCHVFICFIQYDRIFQLKLFYPLASIEHTITPISTPEVTKSRTDVTSDEVAIPWSPRPFCRATPRLGSWSLKHATY